MSLVHHLALRVHDLERMAAFYEAWFGLTVVRDLRPRALWLGLGRGAVLMLELRAASEPAIDVQSLELVAFAIDAAQRPALRARLLSQQMLEAETEHTLYFRDPEGRRVAASSFPLG
jgi:glyoxylase I family protein